MGFPSCWFLTGAVTENTKLKVEPECYANRQGRQAKHSPAPRRVFIS
jgi:hypothetical protein